MSTPTVKEDASRAVVEESTPLLSEGKSPVNPAQNLCHPGEPPLMSMLETRRWRRDMPWYSYVLLALWTPFGILLCGIRFLLFFLGYCIRLLLVPCKIDYIMYRITYTLCGFIVKTDRSCCCETHL